MTVRQLIHVVELRTKAISVSTYTLGTLYVLMNGVRVRPLPAVLLAVAVLCVDMGTTAFNSFYDYMRGVDSRAHNREPDKVLVHDDVAPGHALVVSLVLYTVAGVTGIVVALMSTWWIVAVGALGLAVGFFYNGGPLPISRTPLGELFAGGFLGSVLFLVVVAVHAGSVDARALLASLPSTLVIASVLTVNNTCDVAGDREAGRHTLSVLVGRHAGEALVYILGCSAFGLMLAMALVGAGGGRAAGSGGGTELVFPALPRIGLVIVPAGFVLAVVVWITMHLRGYGHDTKRQNMGSVVLVVLIYTITYGATFATSY